MCVDAERVLGKMKVLLMLFSAAIVLWGVYERVYYGGAGVLLSLGAGFSVVYLLLGFSRSEVCRNCVKRVKTQ
jgi:hypothetical protein